MKALNWLRVSDRLRLSFFSARPLRSILGLVSKTDGQRLFCLVAGALYIFLSANPLSAVEIKSPDENIVLNFDLKTSEKAKGCPIYSVSFRGRPVLGDSRLGLELRSGPLDSDFLIVDLLNVKPFATTTIRW
jgi:Glycosyl-hydrolase 97 N-terminal